MAGLPPPQYRTINPADQAKYFRPGGQIDMRRLLHGRRKTGATKHGLHGVHANRLATAAKHDVWRHRSEAAGQR